MSGRISIAPKKNYWCVATNSGKNQFPLHDRTQLSSIVRIRIHKRRIRRTLEKPRQHWVNILWRWRRLSHVISGRLLSARDKAYLALVNELYENQLFECFHLNGCGSRAWTTCTYLKELLCFSPAFERSIHHTPSIMVHQVVVVMQVRNRRIYGRNRVRKHRKRRSEMSG